MFRNPSTIIKLIEVSGITVYWNSLSEMFIPNSVWETSKEFKYGIFELIDADFLHTMMKDQFTERPQLQNQHLIDPFNLKIQFAFRNTYNLISDEYKYRIAIMNEKVRVNLNPLSLRDIMRFQ